MTTDASSKNQSVSSQILYWGVAALLIGMPVHAFVVIALGKFIGYQTVWQAWKEALIVAMLCAAVVRLYREKVVLKELLARHVNWLVVVLLVLGIGMAKYGVFFGGIEVRAMLFGVKTTLVPLALFLIAQVGAKRWRENDLITIILFGAAAVAVGALVQTYLITPSSLEKLGYGASTILPIQLVDPAVSSIRAFSTSGGPNQLGAFMILPTILAVILFVRQRKALYLAASLLTTWALVLSFSRSAWLGLIVGMFTATVLLVPAKLRPILAGLSIGLLVIAALTLSSNALPKSLQNTNLQYYVLHGSYGARQEVAGSDVGRLGSLEQGLTLIQKSPLGLGVGAAGPASFRGTQAIITENWYMQIALELGLLGLGLCIVFFIWIGAFLARAGWAIPSPLSLALCAGLAGLAVTNLFLHAWADSTLSITYFALLGVVRGKYE